MRRLALLFASLAALAVTANAAAANPTVAEVRGAHGGLRAATGAGPYAYPDSLGAGLRVGDSTADARGVELRDVSLLNGQIWAYRVFVPAHGLRGAAIESLVIGGREIAVHPNKVVHLSARTYVVLLQQAFVPGRKGRNEGLIGMRIYVGDPGFGVPVGTQLLVGLTRPAVGRRPKGVAGNAAVLGVDPKAVADNPPIPLSGPVELLHPSIGGRAVAIAERYLGIPYVWAGADPETGFDCSGLTMYVYEQLGISLPHFTGTQWTSGTRIDDPADLVPGDLVFFFPQSYGPGHEGLYIGNGEFIHAPHTGDVVKISSLSDPGYALGYMGAVRPWAHANVPTALTP